MELFVWNINQRSSGQKIPGFVSEEIIKSEADIVVLTEFLSAANKRSIIEFKEKAGLDEKYDFGFNEERDKEREKANGVLIAVKKEFAEIKSPVIENLATHHTEEAQPNFIQLDIEVNKRLISIIGTRIQVGGSLNRQEFEERHKQLSSLIEHINTLETKNIIVAGDFNHAFIQGVQTAKYSDIKESYRDKVTFDTYNYHIMKEDFNNIGMTVSTPEGKQLKGRYSCGFKLNDDKPNDGYLKEDHIITTRNLDVSNLRYCHSFMDNYKKDEEWQWKWNKGKKKYEYVIDPPYPDHAILTADVDI